MIVSNLCENESGSSSSSVLLNDENREIYISGQFDDAVFNTVLFSIRQLETSSGDITVFFHTIGGNASVGFGLYDMFKISKNRIIGIGVGSCMSAGVMALLGCDSRYATSGCRFMVHEIQSGVEMTSTTALGVYYKEAERLSEQFRLALCQNSKLTEEEALALCADKEKYLSAEQCLGFGLIDGILIPQKKKVSKKKGRK